MIGPQLTIETRAHNEWTVLDVAGELDLATAPQLAEAIGDGDSSPIVLDLADVTFIDSVGLRSLLQAREALGDDRLHLLAPEGGPVMRLLELTKLGETFSVSSDLP